MDDSFPRLLAITVIAEVIASLVAAFTVLVVQRKLPDPLNILPRDHISKWITTLQVELQTRKPVILAVLHYEIALLALVGGIVLVGVDVQSDKNLIIVTSITLVLLAYLTNKISPPPMNSVGSLIIVIGGAFGLGIKYWVEPSGIADSGVVSLALILWLGFLALLWMCCSIISSHTTLKQSEIQSEFDFLARSRDIKLMIEAEQDKLLHEIRINWSSLPTPVRVTLVPFVPIRFELFKLHLGCRFQADIDKITDMPSYGPSLETTLVACLRELTGLDKVTTTYDLLSDEEFLRLETVLLAERGSNKKIAIDENVASSETPRN